jgi:hypothetical protein
VPTRKQRRRLAKERRHEWEYVYVDDEGREVEAADDEPAPAKPPKEPTKSGRTSTARAGKAPARAAGRKVDPPSWRRVLRRAAVFAPVMLLVVYFLRPKNASAAGIISQVAILLLFFLPFSYYMDAIMYRQYRKRIGDPLPPRSRKRGTD